MTAEQIIVPGLNQAAKPLSVDVTTHGMQVVLHYSEPREFAAYAGIEAVIIGTRMLARAMEADQSVAPKVIEMAMAIIDAAYEMRGDLKPAGGAVKHELIERHRRTLTRRLEVILNSRREAKKTTNAQLAKELTDVLLHEVFA